MSFFSTSLLSNRFLQQYVTAGAITVFQRPEELDDSKKEQSEGSRLIQSIIKLPLSLTVWPMKFYSISRNTAVDFSSSISAAYYSPPRPFLSIRGDVPLVSNIIETTAFVPFMLSGLIYRISTIKQFSSSPISPYRYLVPGESITRSIIKTEGVSGFARGALLSIPLWASFPFILGVRDQLGEAFPEIKMQDFDLFAATTLVNIIRYPLFNLRTHRFFCFDGGASLTPSFSRNLWDHFMYLKNTKSLYRGFSMSIPILFMQAKVLDTANEGMLLLPRVSINDVLLLDSPFSRNLLLLFIVSGMGFAMSYPLQVALTHYQMDGHLPIFQPQSRNFSDPFHSLFQLFKSKGIKGLYRGFSTNLFSFCFPAFFAATTFTLLSGLFDGRLTSKYFEGKSMDESHVPKRFH